MNTARFDHVIFPDDLDATLPDPDHMRSQLVDRISQCEEGLTRGCCTFILLDEKNRLEWLKVADDDNQFPAECGIKAALLSKTPFKAFGLVVDFDAERFAYGAEECPERNQPCPACS